MSLKMLAIPLAGCLGVWGIIGLLLHAVTSLLLRISVLKKYSAKQLLIATATNAVNTASSVGKTVSRVVLWLTIWWITVILIFFFFSFIYVTYTEYPATWFGAVRGYNLYFSPFLYQVVLVPLRVIDLFLRALIPIWNSAWWFLKTLGVQGILPIVVEQISVLVDLSMAIFSLVGHMAEELSRFMQSFACNGKACLQAERGIRDVLTSMADVRDITVHALRIGHAFCGTLAAPLDALLYPLLDLNLAECVHNLVNAIVQLFVVVPWSTTLRCAEKEDNQYAVLMCTPDLVPTFNFLAASISNLGLLIDNWANVVFLIVETVVGGSPPVCAARGFDGIIPDLLAADPVFTGATTVLVGLTDWLYAVTDGNVAVYTGHGAQARIARWPSKVDPLLGVAAVTFGQLHEMDVTTFSSGRTNRAMQTTALLGCECLDTLEGLAVSCSILPMNGVPNDAATDSFRLRVLFSSTLAASLYTCAGVDLYVRSVRWSFKRYETVTATLGSSTVETTLPSNDCISRGTCRELDATVWLVPRCGQDVQRNAPTACLPTAPCMPFCMASRVSGSGAANLVFVRANDWRSGATVLGQDCALYASTTETIQLGVHTGPNVSSSRAASYGRDSLLQTGSTEVYGFSSRRACTRAYKVTSVTEKTTARVSNNVRLSGQPFVITGDTTLTTIDLGGGAESVQVERLEGDETDVFSLNYINQELPALPKAVVPLDESELRTSGRVTIPYGYQTTRIAATNSRNYLFYASNPNADVLGPYLEYCSNRNDPAKISRFGLLFLSSYSQIRVYRVSAYRRCATFSCGDDLVRFVVFDGFSRRFGRECTEVFNVSVQSLEYLNEENIAVTVRSSRVTTWDAQTLEFFNATIRTYWLNPSTMRIKDTIWQTDVASSNVPTSVPQLCPELQRLPRVGTFAAEVLNAGVFLLKYVVLAITLTPGLVAAWKGGPRCPNPGSALGHSALSNCGEDAFSLDDFFDSLDDAGAVFWHSLSLIARLIGPEDQPQIASALSNVLDGMAQYGQGAVDVWAGGRGVLHLVNVPVREQAMQLWATVRSGTLGDAAKMIDGLSMPGAGLVAWVRFIYRVLSTYTLALLKRFLDPLQDVTLNQAFTLFWANLFDLKGEFTTTVTNRVRLACGGIKLIFGVDNPWADLLYHQCGAAAEMTDGMLSLIVDIFVQIPMAKCVCKDSAGQDVAWFVRERCAPSLPVSLLPTLYTIANQETGRLAARNMACERVLDRVKTSIGSSLDGWFAHQFLAMDAAGNSIDYLSGVFDDKGGRCLDFQNDPHVVVIVPQPVDYFVRCGTTSLCKQICSAEWKAFQEAGPGAAVRPPQTVKATVESLFFPGQLDDDLVLTNATAVVELKLGQGGCLARRSLEENDLAVAVAEVSGQTVNVQVWCSPRMASGSLYRSNDGKYGPLEVPGALLQLQFGDDSGTWLAALSQLEDSVRGVFLLNSSGVFRAPDVIIADGDTLVRIENLWVLEGLILIDVLARRLETFIDPETGLQGSSSTPQAIHFTLLPPLNSGGVYGTWRTSTVDLMEFGGDDYWFTKPAAWTDYLFLPKYSGILPSRVQVSRSGAELVFKGKDSLQAVELPAMHKAVFSPISQMEGKVIAVSREGWDWLKQVRLTSDGFVEGVFGSTPVDYTLKIDARCDERGCEGCLSLQVQRLCNAYSRCALINCVGTPVHQLRPLCGLGGLLRHTGRMGLVSTQGAWSIFTEMLALTMRLSLLTVKEAYLLWPEDKFLCYVCQAKDRSAVFFSILTSMLNGILQIGNADVGYMYGGASHVDTNADAVLTISSTAVNAFMHQVFLYLLYGMAVSHQILMCQASGVIAIIPNDDFTLRIRAGANLSAGDIIAGQCLTVGAEVLASFPQDDQASMAYMVTSMVANSLQMMVIQQIEPFVHMLDGLLAYLLGIVKSLGMLIQSQTMARCNPPDFFLREIVNCPCGDKRLTIVPARRKASAHWCTGVLAMVDSNAQPYYIYNKYSYDELQKMSSGMKAYVECVSSRSSTSGNTCEPPNTPFFAQQGVTTLNVLVKCRENYVRRRWDPAAYMVYQSTYWDLLHFEENNGIPQPPQGVPLSAQSCLKNGDPTVGNLAQVCLEGYLFDAQLTPDEFWAYEHVDDRMTAPEYTDACLVFSGPAEQGIEPFTDCVDGTGGACTLPQHLWSPRSNNDVPLATQHRVVLYGRHKNGLIQRLYSEARAKVMGAIQAALSVWNTTGNPEVQAEFFSVEGDLLHQTMDCIMMGPYSRIDYWPIPDCQDGQECLRGPSWSRDDGNGSQRTVDPNACAAPSTLPYTCGSPGRQSLMRYLVLNMLTDGGNEGNQNASNVATIIQDTLGELVDMWDDVGRYGCLCEDSEDLFSPECCTANSSLLPDHLNGTISQIRAQTVLRALEDDMAALYGLALEKRDVWLRYMQDVGGQKETAGYDWSTSKRAEDEARFDPVKPASTYTAQNEALSPLMREDSTLWDVCHASLKQVFFTLPMSADGAVVFDEPGVQFDGDPATLPEQVARFTKEAMLRSPLFRHYLPKHAPSESLLCSDEGANHTEDEGTVSYTPFVQDSRVLLSSQDLPADYEAYHPLRFAIGHQVCLCGWQQIGSRCKPSSRSNTMNQVCALPGVSCAEDNTYDHQTEHEAVLQGFSSSWHCPEFEPTPTTGFLDPGAHEQWFALNRTTLITSSRDLYRHGRAGLRPGNLLTFPQALKDSVNPRTRELPLKRAKLTTCGPLHTPDSLIEPFLDNLFPANHGTDDSAGTVYCLRYAIELARLEVLRLLDLPGPQVLQQEELSEVWRRRCASQLHLLHLCTSLQVFRPLVEMDSREPYACPFFTLRPSSQRVAYVTPQCLVSVDGVFYDPCAGCLVCKGPTPAVLDAGMALDSNCTLSFDPRRLITSSTVPLGWVDGQHPLPDPVALLNEDWVQQLLNEPVATANMPRKAHERQSWFSVEGPMTDNSLFCDTVMDWWPDAWTFPVGYHVTVPCEASDTAYRSFTQSFALDEETNTLVYQHDLLRDIELVDSHFGGAGLCRSGTFGMPMMETNNMRYCTRMPLDDTEDFTLPLPYQEEPEFTHEWGPWQCTSSSSQLPWPTIETSTAPPQSSRISLGTIPNMPPETSDTYPATDEEFFEVGPWQEIIAAGNSWGGSPETLCQDYRLLTCKTDASCLPGYRCRGRVCSFNRSQDCTADSQCGSGTCDGVCLDGSVQCIRHRECPDDKMCSGVGICETPVLAVQNRLTLSGGNITLGLAVHGDDCGAGNRDYSLLQASYWGNTGRDLLKVHGLCSFQDWFKYTSTYIQEQCSIQGESEDFFVLDQARCPYLDLSKPSTNQTKWWPSGNIRPDVMFLRPTNCDRDYERLQGFTQCAPLQGRATLIFDDERLQQSQLLFDRFVRLTESPDSKRIRLAHMQESNNSKTGFLGTSGRVERIQDLMNDPFVPCGVVGQCFPAPFTVNGVLSLRLIEHSSGWINYTEKDAFTCGAFGIMTELGCTLDLDRLALYRHLCVADFRIPSCFRLNKEIERICLSIPVPYQAINADRQVVLAALRELFYVFPTSSSLDQYLDVTTCIEDLHAAIRLRATNPANTLSLGIYYPFMFSLYELPFDWFYQCTVMSGLRINPSTHIPQNCRAYQTRAERNLDNYKSVSVAGDTLLTYLQFVRGGYLRADVESYHEQQMAAVVSILDNITTELARTMFGGQDFSYPRCSRHIRWRVGDYGELFPGDATVVPEARAVIWNWYDQQSCSLNWHEKLLDKLETMGVARDTWTDRLTMPDQNILAGQDGVQGRPTIIELAKRFMLTTMQIVSNEQVQTQDTGALRFNTLPPFAYDHGLSPIPAHLEPRPSIHPGTDRMDESVNRTCVFPPLLDPAFASMVRAGVTLSCAKVDVRSGARVDKLQTCNRVNCTTVPVLYKRNGKFRCRYVAETVITTLDCNEDVPGCQTRVMDTVYDAMMQLYYATNPVSPILPVRSFSWFQPRSWVFDAVDLSEVLDHERNIQPNMERSVMCEVTTNEADAVRFTACNNPHYLRLQRHVDTHYKHEGGVQVPAGAQLEWPVSRSILAKGIMLHYSNQNRSIRQRYMDALFDDETVCKGDPAEHVCRAQGPLLFESTNPWTLGNFNPYELCDVDFTTPGEGAREYIDSFCLEKENSNCVSFRSQSPPGCALKDQRLVQQVGVPRFTAGVVNDYNLCFHRLEESVEGCFHDQGLLGGYDGLPVASLIDSSTTMIDNTPYKQSEVYTVARNLYEESVWSIPQDFRGGIFRGTNPLWAGDIGPYGYLRIEEDDIGGHRIGLVVKRQNETSDAISVMLVERVNLHTHTAKQFLDSPAASISRPVQEWLPDLQAGMIREDAAIRSLYALQYELGQLGASCPLQRWAFYSSSLTAFAPTLPAAQRAAHLFHRIHGGRFAHPTMRFGLSGQFLGRYRTSNGFCACPVIQNIPQVQCRVPVTESSKCSLKYTMLSLLGLPGDVRTSYVFPTLTNDRSTRACKMMLDWPMVDGTLKDGSPVFGAWEKASDSSNKICHVLDRFRPFQYRYQAAPSLARDRLARNTVTAGVCATSRIVTLRPASVPSPYSRCLRTTLGQSDATFACNTTSTTFTMPRRTALTLAQALARRSERRSSCASCSAPPKFRSQQGRPVPPESSFGRLVRLSPERTLANDLHALLCPLNACTILLNESAWTRGEFMRNYMLSPQRLFLNQNHTTLARGRPKTVRDVEWTRKGWVYCPTASALATGEGCLGTISREQWVKHKTTLCPQMVRSYSASLLNSSGDPMARTSFCSIDKFTDAVCKAMFEARQLIIQANCIAREDASCMPVPFVYHPTNYDPSNNAWVHDSVRAFYRRIDPQTCPENSENEKALYSFAQMYQRQCPANAVNLFAGLIQGIRVLVVDVALIFTTLVSLAFNGLQLLSTADYLTARSAIAAHWAYIRIKAGASLNAFGDIMVDALLNSGEAGARIMQFLEKTCGGLNMAATWFLNIWCNFVQRYMLQFMAGVRRFLGISGATFEMIQDFIDEIFQGILPAAFIAKYANDAFQNILVERYSEPSDERKRKKAGSSFNVPDSAARQQQSRLYRFKKGISNIGQKVAGFAKGVASVTKYGIVPLMLVELVSQGVSIAQEKRLRELYPDNFTLFDLTSIADVIDELQEFLLSPLSQQTCIAFQIRRRFNPDATAFSCARVSLDTYNATRRGTTSIEPTMCWANAAPSIGQNSMFACTGVSTCCETAECTTRILCASCPEPALPGINKYGCDSLRLRCACSQTAVAFTRCAANRQCTRSSQCELVSSLDGVSYGTIPCANCPNTARVMCLMPPTGMPARCACMLAGGPTYDLCNDRTGLRTPVDSSRLCAYLHNRREGETNWAFDMDDLIMVPCVQVSMGVCSLVYPPGQATGLSLRMVVAESLRFSSRGARRMLLQSDDQVAPDPAPPVYDAYESEYELGDSKALHDLLMAPGWNTTAAPCSSLALAYQDGSQKLGLLETYVLHRCAFWRFVGRRVIVRYNLSEVMAGHETFLLSMDDFVFAAMKPDVAYALVSNVGLFASALMHHPSMKPVRALGVMLANRLEHFVWQQSLTPSHVNATNATGRSRRKNRSSYYHEPPITPRPIPRRAKERNISKPTVTPPGRHLLAVQDVLAYSVRVLENPDAISVLPPRVFGAWSTEDFSWPPRYNYSLAACPIALTTLDILTHVALVNKLYFANFNATRPEVSRRLRDNLPPLAWTARLAPSVNVTSASSWASAAFRWLLDLAGTRPAQFVAFFNSAENWSFSWLLSSLTRCDLASTLTCSEQNRDALMSTIVFVLLFVLVRLTTSALGVSFLSILFLFSYPWFILWYTYGLSPTCFPSLPTCLLGDIIRTIEYLLPNRLEFHPSLRCEQGPPDCLRPCELLGFEQWTDPLAFSICDIDDLVCTSMLDRGPLGVEWLDEPFYKPLLEAMGRFQVVLRAGDVGGHRVCAWVSFVSVVPAIALLISGLAVVAALFSAIMDMLPLFIQFILQAFVFLDT